MSYVKAVRLTFWANYRPLPFVTFRDIVLCPPSPTGRPMTAMEALNYNKTIWKLFFTKQKTFFSVRKSEIVY